MRRLVLTAGGILIAAVVMCVAFLSQHAGGSGSVLIERTQYSVTSVVDELRAAGAIENPQFMRFALKAGLRLTGRTITPGWYHVTADQSRLDVLRMLVYGRREPLVKITVPEGFTMFQIASRLQFRAQVDSAAFLAWATSEKTRQKYRVATPSMEGSLLPATYHVIRAESPSVIGTMMADEFSRVWKMVGGGLNNRRDSIITLASIVQKEAVRYDELPTIAGVYANRLRIGMRLEADPTLQYGRDLTITRADLRDATNRYNTYQHSGLPPGPICNPGQSAIKAAISPERHEFLFFVARGDGTRGHRFARSYAEHLKNVASYRASLARR
ncbi:MAG: endolytic transglycosylase MltG [Ignavibacteria bacterium]|jgi:UPF0755 protein